MKLIKYTGILMALILAGCSAASRLKKADAFYEKTAYAKAAEIYADIVDGKNVDTKHIKMRLADCYYQYGESQKAEEIYIELVKDPTLPNEDIYKYAQTLKENGKYAESKEWMEKFTTSAQADQRAEKYKADSAYLTEILAQEPYFELKHLKENTPHSEFGGYPMTDSLVYFVSNRRDFVMVQHQHSYNAKRFLDLYGANRAKDGELSEITRKSKRINKRYHEGSLCFTPDKKKVYFTQNNMAKGKMRRDDRGVQNLKIHIAEVQADGKWINKTEFPLNNKDYSVGHPSLSTDGKTLYFASDMPGGVGGSDIYKVEVKENGTFGEPINLGTEINTEGQEMFPWISAENILFFSSDGQPGLGGLDVYGTIFKSNGEVAEIINLGKPVNSEKDDFAFLLTSNDTTGYVSSNRTTGTGSDDIYATKQLRPLKLDLVVQGVVKDKHSREPIAEATVELLDAERKVIATLTSDKEGKYEFSLDPEKKYFLSAKKENYFDNIREFNTINLPKDEEVLKKSITLEKDPGLSLLAIVTDAKTKQPLDSVTMLITDNMTGQKDTLLLPVTGMYQRALADKKLNDRGSYNFELFRDGYIPKTVTYNTKFDREGQYEVHAEVDMSMDPIVKDLSEMVEINPINFDLNKYNIRPDAARELDKIVEIMNEYPDMVVELGAHTDCRGSKAYNTRLSDRRAKSSARYIQKRINDPKRIYGKGYGETKLLNNCACEGRVKSNCSEEDHAENRRTEFRVISVGKENVKVKNNSSDSFDD